MTCLGEIHYFLYLFLNMAGVTVPSHRKGCLTVMTGPAIFTLGHVAHQHFLSPVFWFKHIWMTFITKIPHFHMDFVAENGVANGFIFPSQVTSMTGCTVSLDRKSGITVMAGSAIFTVIHKGHGHLLCAFLWFKQVRMTIATTVIHIKVHRMAKCCFTDVILLP